jgi:hypothetical protein
VPSANHRRRCHVLPVGPSGRFPLHSIGEAALFAFPEVTIRSFDVPSSEPSALVAGDTWLWNTAPAAYPTSQGWTLTYAFTGPQSFTITVTDITGSVYNVNVPAATSAGYAPGNYQWVAYVTATAATVSGGYAVALGERYQIAHGVIYVQPNLAAQKGDQRSHNAKMLSLIEAELERRLTGATVDGGQGATEKYTIHGRAIERTPIETLNKLKVLYEWRVWRERNPGCLGAPVQSTFSAPGGYNGFPAVISG